MSSYCALWPSSCSGSDPGPLPSDPCVSLLGTHVPGLTGWGHLCLLWSSLAFSDLQGQDLRCRQPGPAPAASCSQGTCRASPLTVG